jgi:hypothetical protein
MALIEINWNPSGRELRQFSGIWFPVSFALLGGLVWYQAGDLPVAILALWVVAGTVSVAGLVNPSWIRPVYLTWMALSYPVGWIVSRLLLAVIFYLALTPLGWVMRRLGRDPMARRFDHSAKTYWVSRRPSSHTSRYFHQT